MPFQFGGTALLIVVGVALDTVQQIEGHLISRNYEGFAGPRGPRIRGRLRPARIERSRSAGGASMNLILLGPPGAGKGTQAKRLVPRFGHPADLHRGHPPRRRSKDGTELGKQAGPLMAAGKLVPDELVMGIVKDRLLQPDAAKGFILDGFPRTIPQAEALDEVLREARARRSTRSSRSRCPIETLVERISGRRSCPKDGSVYHVVSEPAPARGHLRPVRRRAGPARGRQARRASGRRMQAYAASTAPLKDFYARKGLLRAVDGVGAPGGHRGRRGRRPSGRRVNLATMAGRAQERAERSSADARAPGGSWPRSSTRSRTRSPRASPPGTWISSPSG